MYIDHLFAIGTNIINSIYRTDATAGFSTVQKDVAVEHIWPIIVQDLATVEDWAATLKGVTGKI
jgi:hypothetical protein